MNIPLPHTSHLLPFIIGIILLFGVVNLHAQRLEVHINKDLSPDTTANRVVNKAWGVGGAIDIDQLIRNVVFRVNFNWTRYRKKDDITNPNYQRLTGGISALYSAKIVEKLMFQGGVELNYTHLIYSHVYGIDSTNFPSNLITLSQTGSFIGIGTHVGLRYDFSSRLSAAFNFIPTYLLPVRAKSSIIAIEPKYTKGIWLFQLQLGFSYRLFKPD